MISIIPFVNKGALPSRIYAEKAITKVRKCPVRRELMYLDLCQGSFLPVLLHSRENSMYLLLPLQGFLQHFLECIHGILVIGHSYVGEDSFDSCKNGYSLLYPFVCTFFICVDPKDGSIVLCQESKPSEAFPCLFSLDCLPGGTVFHGPCDTDH